MQLSETLEHIVVIQFGSKFLKVGRALDPEPFLIPAVVAHRLNQSSSPRVVQPSPAAVSSATISTTTSSSSTSAHIAAREAEVNRMLQLRRRVRAQYFSLLTSKYLLSRRVNLILEPRFIQ
jgi:hypothetical protein